jgi:serine/threonine-protein kinase
MPVAAAPQAPTPQPLPPRAPVAVAPVQPRAIAGTRAASLLGSAAPDAVARPAGAATGVNGSGTAEAAPLFAAGSIGAGTAEAAPLFVGKSAPPAQARPSVDGATSQVVGDRTDTGGAPPIGGGTAQGSGLPPGGSTAQANALPPEAVPPPQPAAPARPAKRAKGAVPLALVLLLASGVSAAVVGGIYVAKRSASAEDHNDAPIVMPTPTAVHADPQPGQAEPAPTSPIPAGTPGKNVIRTQPHPGTPARPPGYLPPAHPPGSSKPDLPPPGMPQLPIIIPSNFPFPLPGPPPAQPPNRGGAEPPGDPSGRPTRRGGMPPLEPIPRPAPGAEAILPTEPRD